MSKLLINENPLIISPTLVIELGSYEAAAFLQQLHFWVSVSQHHQDGQAWVFNTQDQCVEMMRGTISKSTAKRIVKMLKDKGLIKIASLHNNKWNHTNFFTINYEEMAKIEQKYSSNPCSTDWLKMNQSNGSNCANRMVQDDPNDQTILGQSLQKNTSEDNKQNIYTDLFEEFWNVVPNKDGKKTAATAFKKAIKLISLQDMIAAYKAYIQICDSQNRFKKNPSTWLNQECWNDETVQSFLKAQNKTQSIPEQQTQSASRPALVRKTYKEAM